jgi:aryl-alcohol dehydrogenase-like predicted oxidoreductase
VRQRLIADVAVSAIGFGGVNLSIPEPVSERDAERTIHAALDAGVTLIDTAHAYTTVEEEAHNERLVARSLATHPRGGDVLVATKGGHFRAGEHDFPVDGRPETIRAHCETSLRTLGVETIGLYQLHWPDPRVPVAESMGAFAELQREGKVRLVGVSNFSVEQIEEARSVVEVASVQNRFSPAHREDRPVLDHCAGAGIAYLSYTPLDGATAARTLPERLPAFARVAAERGVSPHRVVLAWHLAQAPVVIPIPGARRPDTIADSAAAADLELTPDELALLDA